MKNRISTNPVVMKCSKCGVQGNELFTPSRIKKVKSGGIYYNWCRQCCKAHDIARRAHNLTNTTDKVIECGICGVKGGIDIFPTNRFKMAKKKTHCIKCYGKKKRASINYRLRKNMSNRIKVAFKRYKSLKKDYGTMTKYIGCTMEEFVAYFESKFEEGMTWENYGEWHIDHIKPLAMFDLEDQEQVTEAFNYANMQPLWAEDNLKKHSNYNGKYYGKKK